MCGRFQLRWCAPCSYVLTKGAKLVRMLPILEGSTHDIAVTPVIVCCLDNCNFLLHSGFLATLLIYKGTEQEDWEAPTCNSKAESSQPGDASSERMPDAAEPLSAAEPPSLPHLQLLWDWSCEITSGLSVTCIDWNKVRYNVQICRMFEKAY